jgi:gas vesicle protein
MDSQTIEFKKEDKVLTIKIYENDGICGAVIKGDVANLSDDVFNTLDDLVSDIKAKREPQDDVESNESCECCSDGVPEEYKEAAKKAAEIIGEQMRNLKDVADRVREKAKPKADELVQKAKAASKELDELGGVIGSAIREYYNEKASKKSED